MFRVKFDRFERNEAGFRQLLQSPTVQGDLRGRGQRVVSGAGPGHVIKSELTGKRARVVVITATFEARKALAERKALIRAIDRARG